MVHNCPKCELKFPTKPEVTAHIEFEHGIENASKWGQDRYKIEGTDIPPLYPEPDPDSEPDRDVEPDQATGATSVSESGARRSG